MNDQKQDFKNLRAVFKKIGNGYTKEQYGKLLKQYAGRYYSSKVVEPPVTIETDVNKVFDGGLGLDEQGTN